MVPQIPYAAIGIGIAVILGIWSFLVAETIRERALILGIPILVYLVPIFLQSRTGHVISLVGFMLYGLGCIIYLRTQGIGIR